jgi:hypothetical protein
MTSTQVMAVAVLAVVLTWSTVMTVLGRLTAVAALLPSLVLLVQRIVAALRGTDTRPGRPTDTPTAPAGSEERSQ